MPPCVSSAEDACHAWHDIKGRWQCDTYKYGDAYPKFVWPSFSTSRILPNLTDTSAGCSNAAHPRTSIVRRASRLLPRGAEGRTIRRRGPHVFVEVRRAASFPGVRRKKKNRNALCWKSQSNSARLFVDSACASVLPAPHRSFVARGGDVREMERGELPWRGGGIRNGDVSIQMDKTWE
jgi:hypothetical protein